MAKSGLFWSLPFLIIMIGMSVYGWMEIPDGTMVARHSDINGNPDGYSSKMVILLGQPLLALFLMGTFAVIPQIFPRKENLEKSRTFYLVAWIGAMAILAGAHGMIVWGGATGQEPNPAMIIALVGAFFVLIGNYMAKSKSNWVAGLRNPWTLSSEHAWTVANRMCGYMFVLTGVAVVVCAFTMGVIWSTSALLVGSFSAIIASTVASYFAWRNDPEAGASSS
ncbi:SdpI family protein [Parvularcula sp. IMCC14364]|uniref:SdpI family protein n=1 Tax=Parvularcula sp. IMCC14364 TaxID=3067902 RepID=UPI00274278C9|nr:SdpI family protein [Parvularcula sp. IMCC14364]